MKRIILFLITIVTLNVNAQELVLNKLIDDTTRCCCTNTEKIFGGTKYTLAKDAFENGQEIYSLYFFVHKASMIKSTFKDPLAYSPIIKLITEDGDTIEAYRTYGDVDLGGKTFTMPHYDHYYGRIGKLRYSGSFQNGYDSYNWTIYKGTYLYQIEENKLQILFTKKFKIMYENQFGIWKEINCHNIKKHLQKSYEIMKPIKF